MQAQASSSVSSASFLSPTSATILRELGTSGVAVSVATFCTNPIDVVKVRVQLQSPSGASPSLLGTGSSIVRTEGISSLWKGATPAVVRAMTYGGLRIGLYKPIKEALDDTAKSANTKVPGVYTKLAAGCTSGAFAAALCNPTELIKTRLQAAGAVHTSSAAVMRDIVGREGFTGLWRGTVPSMARVALLTASQCVAYDAIKTALIEHAGASDAAPLHVAAGALTGVVTTTVTCPADVLKTRMFVDSGAGGREGVLQVTRRMVAEEGVGAFFRGWMANYARLGPQTLLIFVVAEQLRRAMGLSSL